MPPPTTTTTTTTTKGGVKDYFRRPKLLACMLFHRLRFFFPDSGSMPIAYEDARVARSEWRRLGVMAKSLRALQSKTRGEDGELRANIRLLLSDLSVAEQNRSNDYDILSQVYGAQLEHILALATARGFVSDPAYKTLDTFLNVENVKKSDHPTSYSVSATDEDYVTGKRCFMVLFARDNVVLDEFEELSPVYEELRKQTDEKTTDDVDRSPLDNTVTRRSRSSTRIQGKIVHWFRSVRLKIARYAAATFRMNCLSLKKKHTFSVCAYVAGIRAFYAFLENNNNAKFRARYPELDALRALRLHKHIRGDVSDDTQFALLHFLVVLFFPHAADDDDAAVNNHARNLLVFVREQVRKLVRGMLSVRKAELVYTLNEIRFKCVNMVTEIYRERTYWKRKKGMETTSFVRSIYDGFVFRMVVSTRAIDTQLQLFEDTLLPRFSAAFPEEVDTPAVWSIRYDHTNLWAFLKSVTSEFASEEDNKASMYTEEVIMTTRHFQKKKFLAHFLIFQLAKAKEENKKYTLSSVSDKFFRDDPKDPKTKTYEDDINAYLRLLNHLVNDKIIAAEATAEQKNTVSSLLDEIQEARIRDAVLKFCDNFMAAKIGAFIVSSRAFSYFVSREFNLETKRTTSWKDFMAEENEKLNAYRLIAKNYGAKMGDSKTKHIFQLVRTSPANDLAFEYLRLVLTEPLYFANNIQKPDDKQNIELAKVSVCGIFGHGACRLNKNKTDLQSHPVPEHLTIYYITDVLSDLKFTMHTKERFDKMEAFIIQDLKRHPLLQEEKNGSSNITEEKLVMDVFVANLRQRNDSNNDFYDLDGMVSRGNMIEQARNIYLEQKSFIVKKYVAGDQFPFRVWDSENQKEQIFFIPNIKGEAMETKEKTNSEHIINERCKKETSNVLVLVDFTCKALVDDEDAWNNVWLNTPENYAKLLNTQYQRGKVIAFAGGGQGTRKKSAGRMSRLQHLQQSRRL